VIKEQQKQGKILQSLKKEMKTCEQGGRNKEMYHLFDPYSVGIYLERKYYYIFFLLFISVIISTTTSNKSSFSSWVGGVGEERITNTQKQN